MNTVPTTPPATRHDPVHITPDQVEALRVAAITARQAATSALSDHTLSDEQTCALLCAANAAERASTAAHRALGGTS